MWSVAQLSFSSIGYSVFIHVQYVDSGLYVDILYDKIVQWITD